MKKNRLPHIIIIVTVLISILFHLSVSAEPFNGESPPNEETPEIEVIDPNFAILNDTLSDGRSIEGYLIGGPPEPPDEYAEERLASMVEIPARSTIEDFPSYDWVFGCSAVSAAMIAGYHDRNGWPNIYEGPTNDGLMPLTDTLWPTWFDVEPYEYPNNPLVASHYGVDGRTSYGSIDNYWISYESEADDPYITNSWPEHTWDTAVGDFMKTSQSPYILKDGYTWFYNDTEKLYCSEMEEVYSTYHNDYVSNFDGTYGRKLFYEARGYSVGKCYNQRTDNRVEGGFTLDEFKAEIDAGYPVLLNLIGHSVVGFGYDGSTIYIRDTWDSDPNNIYSMQWGGYYAGKNLVAVSVVHLVTPPPIPTAVTASDGTYADKVRVSWLPSGGATSYEVYRSLSDSPAGAQRLVSGHTSSSYDDITAAPGNLYYYWVKACDSETCSDYSALNSGFRKFSPPIGVNATDGAFTDKVQISWDWLMGATYYQIFRNIIDSHSGQADLGTSSTTSFDDTTAVLGTSYYYWVKACNALGCSDYSEYDRGHLTSVVDPPGAPSSIMASDGTYTDKVFIDWPPVIGASRYIVLRGEDNKPGDAKVLVNDLIISSYDDTTATPAVSYYYWVMACNGGGCSGNSKPDTGWREKEPVVYSSYLPLITIDGSLSDIVTNGDFEQGAVDWATYSTHGWDIIIHQGDSPVPAHDGDWLAKLGGDFDDTSSIMQTINISSEIPYLHYWYWADSGDACGFDFFRIKIDSVAIHTETLCLTNNTGEWTEGVINLSPYIGLSRTLEFEVTADEFLNSTFFLDDVSLSASAIE